MLEPTKSEGRAQLQLSLDQPLKLETPQRQVFRVSELNGALQRLLGRHFQSIWVAGEISGCRIAASGHYYFVLKDSVSQLKAVLFKSTARSVRQKPQDGIAVLVRGSLEVYEARGEYQLIVEALELQGAGALQLAFEDLKKRLEAEGAFSSARKRPLPLYPKRIGIVSSPSGAVIRDILHVFERRFPGLHIRLYPAAVQGDGSAAQVCDGIHFFSAQQWADIVIVARGGGSLQDLWTFNEEAVARAILSSRVPVISAIGHETDFTICDFVSDLRAPTPSAAAEIAICTRESLDESFSTANRRAYQAIRYRLMRSFRDLHQRGVDRAQTVLHRGLSRRLQHLDDLDARARMNTEDKLDRYGRRLTEITRRLEGASLHLRLARVKHRLQQLNARFTTAANSRIVSLCRRHEALSLQLGQLSPLSVLSRGYAIVQNDNGQALRAAEEAETGQALRIRLSRGELAVRVQSVDPAP